MSFQDENINARDYENFRMYYQLQYDRIDKLEQRREFFSNLIITVSITILTAKFSTEVDIPSDGIVVLTLLLVAINSIAGWFIDRSRIFVKTHQARASEITKRVAPFFYIINDSVQKHDSENDLLRRSKLYVYIHMAIIACLIFTGLYDEKICHNFCNTIAIIALSLIIIVVPFLLNKWQNDQNDKKFEKKIKSLLGNYTLFKNGAPIPRSNLEISHIIPNKLNLKTSFETQIDNWTGTIYLDKKNPYIASGIFEKSTQSDRNEDWGIINLQLSIQDTNTIYLRLQSYSSQDSVTSYKLKRIAHSTSA